MGFFDDFRAGLRQGQEEENERSAWRQSTSSYRTSKEVEREFESRSDSRLLQEVNSSFTSDENKRIIHSILLRRGYTKVGNNYRRR